LLCLLQCFASLAKRFGAVTRAALCAGRGTAFARSPATELLLKKRRRAEYRLPPHSRSFRQTCARHKTFNLQRSTFNSQAKLLNPKS
jgi:hypothetical protein